jgi:hypothetical protein
MSVVQTQRPSSADAAVRSEPHRSAPSSYLNPRRDRNATAFEDRGAIVGPNAELG